MIITSSNVNMASTRAYSKRELSYKRYEKSLINTGIDVNNATFLNFIPKNTSEEAEDVNEETNKVMEETSDEGNENSTTLQDLFEMNARKVRTSMTDNSLSRINQIRNEILKYLLRMLFGEDVLGSLGLNENCETDTISDAQQNAPQGSKQSTSQNTLGIVTTQFTEYFEYSETEETTFQTTGMVQTSDGRSIDFNVNLTLSRSFTMATSSYINYAQPVVLDPLVINFDCPSATLEDFNFYFDLDSDGEEEELSSLAYGSGFLAYDRNENGVIDDGAELFGTQTGNGFADLAVYDEDNNGWIDEADSIFDKLRVWYKDKDGNDVQFSLKEAGVGAIYLSAAAGDFSLTDDTNQTNAIIRRSGIFLYETGNIGTIQQLDMAT